MFYVIEKVQKGLHEFLFKLLVLRYLMDSEGRIWKCSDKQLYVIEILEQTVKSNRNASRQVRVFKILALTLGHLSPDFKPLHILYCVSIFVFCIGTNCEQHIHRCVSKHFLPTTQRGANARDEEARRSHHCEH